MGAELEIKIVQPVEAQPPAPEPAPVEPGAPASMPAPVPPVQTSVPLPPPAPTAPLAPTNATSPRPGKAPSLTLSDEEMAELDRRFGSGQAATTAQKGGVQPEPTAARAGAEAGAHEADQVERHPRAIQAQRELDTELEQIEYRRLLDELRGVTIERMKQRLALEKMTEDERVDYQVDEIVRRQMEAARLKQMAYEQRLLKDPEFRADEEAKDAEQRAKERAQRLQHAEREAAEEERERQQALRRQQMAELRQQRDEDWLARRERRDQAEEERARQRAEKADAQEEAQAQRRQRQAELRQQRDEDWLARRDKRDALEVERQQKQAARKQQMQDKAAEREADRLGKQFVAQNPEVKAAVDADAARKKREFDQAYHDERMRVDPEYRQQQQEKQQTEADRKRYEPYGPFGPTVKRYVDMFDGLFGNKKKRSTADQRDEAAPTEPASPADPAPAQPTGPGKPANPGAPTAAATPGQPGAAVTQQRPSSPAPTTEPAPPAEQGNPEEPTPGEEIAAAGPEIGAVVELIRVVGAAVGSITRMADLGVQRQEIAMQGGAHQASALAENSAQTMGAAVDWVPLVGPALGKIVSFQSEISAKALRYVENVAIEAATNIRTGVQAMASIVNFDPQALVSQFGELAEKRIPIFGVVIHAATDSLLQLDHAVAGAAKRLSEYNGTLAVQQANEEITNILRDLHRADRFEQSTSQAEGARFDMNQKLADISDRFVPFVMAISEKFFKLVEKLATIVDNGVTSGLEGLDGLVEGVRAILQWIQEHLSAWFGVGRDGALAAVVAGLERIHGLMGEALDRSVVASDAAVREFLRQGANAARPVGPRPIPAAGGGVLAPPPGL